MDNIIAAMNRANSALVKRLNSFEASDQGRRCAVTSAHSELKDTVRGSCKGRQYAVQIAVAETVLCRKVVYGFCAKRLEETWSLLKGRHQPYTAFSDGPIVYVDPQKPDTVLCACDEKMR